MSSFLRTLLIGVGALTSGVLADVPPEAAVAGMEQAGLPRFAAEQIGAVFAELRRGVQAEATDTVRRVAGREPRTLDAWFAEFADAFRRGPAPVG